MKIVKLKFTDDIEAAIELQDIFPEWEYEQSPYVNKKGEHLVVVRPTKLLGFDENEDPIYALPDGYLVDLLLQDDTALSGLVEYDLAPVPETPDHKFAN